MALFHCQSVVRIEEVFVMIPTTGSKSISPAFGATYSQTGNGYPWVLMKPQNILKPATKVLF